jgi:sugar/nucleoside kinase (ribokinase family)
MAPEVIAAGHLCLDLIPLFPGAFPGSGVADILRPGALIETGKMAVGTGGSVSNTGFAMKIFGCDTGYMAKVADDEIGRLLLGLVERYGSLQGMQVAPGEASSYSVVLALPGLDRIFLHCPGTNDTFRSSDVQFDLLGGARLFHFGYPVLMKGMYADGGEELSRIFRLARQTGVTTSLDTALPDPQSSAGKADWPAIYRKTLPHVDLFLPSIEEAFFTLYPGEYLARKRGHPGEDLLHTFRPADYQRVSADLLAMGCAMVALKAAEYGWYFRTAAWERVRNMGRLAPRVTPEWADRQVWCPAFHIEKIASATGAGDVSIAGFLVGLLKGFDLPTSLKLANSAAIQNLSALDSLSGLKGWREVEEGARTLRVRDVPFLHGSGWRWDEERLYWEGPALR